MKKAAVEADKRYKEGNARPLEGIPVAVKDNIDTTDSPTTGGSPALSGHVSKFDSQLWLRLKNLGAISAGNTNMNEFALGTTTYNKHYGNGKNFFDNERTVGGSSGGSAGAVISGAVPWALGTDHSGSIRIPSAYNGLVGYKPSVNRGWPTDFGLKASHIKDTAGPITRSMEDLAFIDELVSESPQKPKP
jgi:Asp-tRNA(Asn)/Glu-tRNA(Gln) amidotransferase A subunit family amidase